VDARGLNTTRPDVASAIYANGTLTIRYEGDPRPVRFDLAPRPVPLAAQLRLEWSEPVGFVLYGADPPGARFTISNQPEIARLQAALRERGPLTIASPPPEPLGATDRGTGDRAVSGRGASARATEDLPGIDPAVFTDRRPVSFLRAAAQRWAAGSRLPAGYFRLSKSMAAIGRCLIRLGIEAGRFSDRRRLVLPG